VISLGGTWTGSRFVTTGTSIEPLPPVAPDGGDLIVSYEPAADRWEVRAGPPGGLRAHLSALVAGFVTVLAGDQSLAMIGPELDQWHVVPVQGLELWEIETMEWTGSALMLWGGMHGELPPTRDGVLIDIDTGSS
jgi:hypothetical protein